MMSNFDELKYCISLLVNLISFDIESY